MTPLVQRLEGMEHYWNGDVLLNTSIVEAFMRFLFCLAIGLVSLGMQGCGFLDDELTTEDSLFGAGGIGLHGTGASGCGGGWGTHGVTRTARRTISTVEPEDIEEFDMEAMNFQSTKASDKLSRAKRATHQTNDDSIILLFVEHENEMDSAVMTFQREGVH
jgi:hypothetical protein